MTTPKMRKVYKNGILVGEHPDKGNNAANTEAAKQLLIEKGLYENISLTRSMWNQARSFADVSAAIYNEDLKQSPFNGRRIAPFVVNSAFAIEIYIKTLSKIHGHSLTGHGLRKLYDTLPVDAKEKINAAIPAAEKNRGLNPGNVDLLGVLDKLNSVFVDWRYIYEKNNIDVPIQEMIFVMEAVHTACGDPKLM